MNLLMILNIVIAYSKTFKWVIVNFTQHCQSNDTLLSSKLMKVFKIAIYATEFINFFTEFSIFWLPWCSWRPSWFCWGSGWDEGQWCSCLWRFTYPCRHQYKKAVLPWKMSLTIFILSKCLSNNWSHIMTNFNCVVFGTRQISKLRFFQCVYLNKHTLFKIENVTRSNSPNVQFL